ncbi:MAG: hypothetical protein KIT84_01840 [Labilithrix sp.]|nr:hypothetical protein [Labilithrix sp.]MCW5809729.1 hypothetical protein [Labilithrix sp.]
MSGATAALLVTLVVEAPIVIAFHPRVRGRAAVLALVANAVTNTLLNRVWLDILPWPAVALVSGEALSFAAEAFVYARLLDPRGDGGRAIAASAAANLASFLAGPVLLGALQ